MTEADSSPMFTLCEAAPGSNGFPSHGQDISLTLCDPADRQSIAECSLWWTTVPTFGQEAIGVLGHFQTKSTFAGAELLNLALARLRTEGCMTAIGPMDGNTWRRYRLMTERGEQAVFFLEPDNPDELPRAFTLAGFAPVAEYYSAVVSDLTSVDNRLPRVAQRLESAGVTIRAVDLSNFAEDLKQVHALSVKSFKDNFLYTELSLNDFIAQYLPIQQYVVPDFVLLAEHNGVVVGFVFAIPDLAQAQRGQVVDTIILKTLAVMPGRLYAGLGALLLDSIHKAAHTRGFKHVIHALMHEQNQSMNLSAQSAVRFRRYTLYGKKLT